ncbi:MAG TPA: 3-oxoacyl-ACP synthase III [Victivallales bacterium]|nr:3-oxoacyl-ACP synthase III [Victivallales bacterium]
MLYKNTMIETLAFGEPPELMSSSKLEEILSPLYSRLKLPEGRLEMMSGIKERRLWPKGFKPSDAAIAAGKKAFEMTKVPREEIGCLIMCSVCRDFLEPATATVIHHELGLRKDSLVFDISNACLGVLTGILLLADMIELGRIRAGMLVAGENCRQLLESTISRLNTDLSLKRADVKKHFSSLTIGSGSLAAIISSAEISPDSHALIGSSSLAFTKHNDLCRGGADAGMLDGSEIFMNTDSETLMIKGVDAAAENWEKFKKELSWNNNTPDLVCTHQVGSAHRKLLFDRLGIDIKKDFPTLESFGNMGSVSCPGTLAIAAESGAVKKGDNVAMLGIGSGINCTMLGVKW